MSPLPPAGTLSRKQSFSRVRASRISTSKKRTAFFVFLAGGAWRHSPRMGDGDTWPPSRGNPAPSMSSAPRDTAGTPAHPAETRSVPGELLNINLPPPPPQGGSWPWWPWRWPQRWPREGQGHLVPGEGRGAVAGRDGGDRSAAQAGGKTGRPPPQHPQVPKALGGTRVGTDLAELWPCGWMSPPGGGATWVYTTL